MSCPFFEPRALASQTEAGDSESLQPVSRAPVGGRLPLIDEYDGLCHARALASGENSEVPIPSDLRLHCCNVGNSKGVCPLCPERYRDRSVRFTVMSRSLLSLELLCVEEEQFAPLHVHRFSYSLTSLELGAEVPFGTMRSQALAFCKSYLNRFQAVAEVTKA